MPRQALIVADDPMLGRAYELVLRAADYDVLPLVRSVTDALDVVRSERIDLVVLDELVAATTTEPLAIELKHRSIPYIVIAQCWPKFDPDWIKSAPYLRVPFEADAFLSAVRALSGPTAPSRGIESVTVD